MLDLDTFILLNLIILLSLLISTGVAGRLSKYWILSSLISSCVTGSSINNGDKGELVAVLANYQQRKSDFDLVVKLP